MRGIPVTPGQLPKTQQDFGQFQKSQGLAGMNTDASASIAAAKGIAVVSPEPYIQQVEATGNVGEAVAKQGHVLTALINKQNEAIGIRKEAEAVTGMDLAGDEIIAAQKLEPDETKWAGIAAGKTKVLKESLLGPNSNLSPAAREAIGLRFGEWEKRVGVSTQISSAGKSFEKAGEAIRANMIRAVDQKDYEGARAMGKAYVEAGYAGPDWLAEQEVAMTKHAKIQLAKEDTDKIDALINSDPDAALGVLADVGEDGRPKSLPNLDPGDVMRARNQAQSVKNETLATVLDTAIGAVDSGDIKTTQQIEAIPGLSERQKVSLKGMLSRQGNAEHKAKLQADIPKNFARLKDAVKGYDPAQDPGGERFSRLTVTIREALPADLRGVLLPPLEKRFKGTAGLEAPDAVGDYIDSQLTNLYKTWGFGLWKGSVFKGDASKPKEREDPKKWGWEPISSLVNDALAKKGAAELRMQQWRLNHPEASVEDAQKAMPKVLGSAFTAADAEALVPVAAAPAGGSAAAAINKYRRAKFKEPDLPSDTPPQSAGNDAGTDLPSGGESGEDPLLDLFPDPDK